MKPSSSTGRLARCGVWLCLGLGLWSGCKRQDSLVYFAPKETPPNPTAALNPADGNSEMTAPEAPARPTLTWALPEGWQEKSPTEMRAASFAVLGKDGGSADVSVVPLPIFGRELELINMWRQQVQLPPITNPDAGDPAEPVAIAGQPGKLFNFVSEQPMIGNSRQRILVAMMTRGNQSWFFKMTGEESFVASQKPGFIQFLKSVSFNEPPAARPHPFIAPESPAPNPAKPVWTVPPDWQELPPPEFLLAEYAITNANGATADVNVARLSGGGGGVLANVNRWRGQLGLPPVAEENLPTMTGALTVAGGQATMVDMAGADAKTGRRARLIGVILPQGGQTWFYKLMGDEPLVGQQKEVFVKFVQSANYPNAR